VVGRRKKGDSTPKNDNSTLDPIEQQLMEELAAKVRFLFEHCRKPNLDRYTYKEVEEGTNGAINGSWISRLASGYAQRPGLMTLKTLSDFFGIDPSFWFNPLDDISKYKIRTQKGDDTLNQVALRSSELSPESTQVVLDLIDSLKRADQRK
jgi:transcriptional regulator with XRE-family HTH domain